MARGSSPRSLPRVRAASKSFLFSGSLPLPLLGVSETFLPQLSPAGAVRSHTLWGSRSRVSPEVSPGSPTCTEHERAPSLPAYGAQYSLFSPESLIGALSPVSRVCVCAACACASLPVFSGCLTLVPHSGVCPSFLVTLASTCTLSLLCQSVLLSPPLCYSLRPPTRGQLLRLSFL